MILKNDTTPPERFIVKRIPYGLQDFESLIQDGYLYVDKTPYIFDLISRGKVFFFARPRRFGKSLLVSTLKAIFEGKKDLFNGLAIQKLRTDWPVHPVIHLDFSALDYGSDSILRESLLITLNDIGKCYNLDLSEYSEPGVRFKALIENLSKKNKVVVLIDEYDKPILEHLDNVAMARECQSILRSIYGKLKPLDTHLKFVFITGVSKFSKTSIFSDLNQLEDLSESAATAELLGYTQEEIKEHFPSHLQQLSLKYEQSLEETIKQMKAWYNGYRFSKEAEIQVLDAATNRLTKPQKINLMYNPVSVNSCLQNGLFQNYWFATGTPSHLVKLIKQGKHSLKEVSSYENIRASNSTFGSCELDAIPLDALLYQAGYLTIKTFDIKTNTGTLGYPNFELRDSMASYLLSLQINHSEGEIAHHAVELRNAFEQKDIGLVASIFTSLFANIPYEIHVGEEAYYHSLIFMALTMLGWDVRVEDFTSKGRTDLCLQFPNMIFLIEFKFNASAQTGLDQIIAKRYFEKYELEGKPILLIGMSFNYKDKKLSVEHVEQPLSSIKQG